MNMNNQNKEIETNLKKIGKDLETVRLEKEISRYNAGLEINLSANHILKIEEGKKNYTINTLLKYANELELDIIVKKREEKL